MLHLKYERVNMLDNECEDCDTCEHIETDLNDAMERLDEHLQDMGLAEPEGWRGRYRDDGRYHQQVVLAGGRVWVAVQAYGCFVAGDPTTGKIVWRAMNKNGTLANEGGVSEAANLDIDFWDAACDAIAAERNGYSVLKSNSCGVHNNTTIRKQRREHDGRI